MRILQLCKKFPFPPKDGESLAITHLCRALHAEGCQVSMLVMNTSKHFVELEAVGTEVDFLEHFIAVPIDNSIQTMPALQSLVMGESYHISRFYSTSYEEALILLLEHSAFDVVQLETLYLTPYLPTLRKHFKGLVVMRSHNVEHEIWQRQAAINAWSPSSWILRWMNHHLKQYEIQHLNYYDLLLPISEKDDAAFRQMGYKGSSHVLPIGMPTSSIEAYFPENAAPTSLSFIGSLDWMPNVAGLEWFLKEVWEGIRAEFPNMEFHVAGRNTPPQLYENPQKGVHIVGEVPDSVVFIAAHPIMVVPILSGSGMRAKILEGMALGKVVITTALGLEGIHAVDGKDIFIANQPEEFLQILRKLNQQPELLSIIGRNARKFIETQYDSRQLAKRLVETYRSFLPTSTKSMV